MRTTVARASLVAAAAVAAVLVRHAAADEGMWPLNRFSSAPVQQKYGFTATPAWLDQARLASIRFADGCSGSFVSPNGLVMTNYHCVVSCVEALATPQRPLVQSGFYAAAAGEELRCPGVEVNQLSSIADVTEQVGAATEGAQGEKFAAARRAIFAAIEKECATGDDVRCEVVSLYRGGKYDLYKYRRLQDVRLVFAPEFDTGFFGGDPDNFMFPRYNLDLSFVRVYDNGVPMKPTHWFPWSPQGTNEGDLVFVTGHPGTTQRQYTTAQLEFERDVRLPTNLQFYRERRGLLWEFGRRGPEQATLARTQLIFVDNTLKVLQGQFAALTERALFERKRSDEAELQAQLTKRPELQKRFGGAWSAIATAVDRRRHPWLRSTAFNRFSGSELFTHALTLVRLADEQARPNAERLPEYSEAALPARRQFVESARPIDHAMETVVLTHVLTHLREQLGLDDPAVKVALGRRAPDEVAAAAVQATTLGGATARMALMKGGRAAVEASADPMIALAKAIDPFAREARKRLEEDIDAVIDRNQELIAQARFAIQGDRVYPDATFTLRLTYGTVKGWIEGDRTVTPFTTLGGLYDRHTGAAPFALPARWLERKAQVALDTPFNFVSDTDIVGGNSGSPVIDRQGRIVGLIFDGNIHSIGGTYWFDPAKNRAVAVDSRGIREALRSVYQADRIVQELAGR